MSSRRLAGWTGVLALSALAACATTNPLEGDAGGPPPDDVDASKSSVDADPGAPDAAPRPDAGDPDASIPQPTPDAAPIDAALPPPPIDAAVAPDAPPCTPTTINLLTNAGFDTGPGAMWTEVQGTGGELILTGTALQNQPPHSPAYAVWFGGYDGAEEQLLQTITVPAGATNLHFKGQRWIKTAELGTTAFDKLSFEILPVSSTTPLESIGGSPTYTNATTTTTWTAFDLPLTGNYAGQTVRLRLHATTDDLTPPQSYPTSFLIDTLVLEATVCQ
jgi:kumamolisin